MWSCAHVILNSKRELDVFGAEETFFCRMQVFSGSGDETAPETVVMRMKSRIDRFRHWVERQIRYWFDSDQPRSAVGSATITEEEYDFVCVEGMVALFRKKTPDPDANVDTVKETTAGQRKR